MRTIKYKHFTVQCALEEPVTTDNFYKHSITVYMDSSIDPFCGITIIPKEILCKYDTEALLSGDEEEAKKGLEHVIKNMREQINMLELTVR